jgi:probable HAF family extracellular repeat protein
MFITDLRFVIGTITAIFLVTSESRAGEWPDHYSVLESYSGPAQFGPSVRQHDWLSLAFHALHPEESYGWNVPLQAKTILDKAAPQPGQVGQAGGQTQFWWQQAGDYVIGGSISSVVTDSNGDYVPMIRAFVAKGDDLRTWVSNPSLATGDWHATNMLLKDINSHGQVVVTPFSGNSSIYDFATDTKIELPPLVAGPQSEVRASGIDESGTVVGSSQIVDGNGQLVKHAFIYRGGVMTDLNDLVNLADGKYLNYATDLSETGEIVANMIDPSKPGWTIWVKLTPTTVPEPATWLIAAACIGFIAISRRNSKSGTD